VRQLATAQLLALPAKLMGAHRRVREAEIALYKADLLPAWLPNWASRLQLAAGALTAAEQEVMAVEAQLAGKAEAVVAAAAAASQPLPKLPPAPAPAVPIGSIADPIAAFDAKRAVLAVAMVATALATAEEAAAEKALLAAEAKAAASSPPSVALEIEVAKALGRERAAGVAVLAPPQAGVKRLHTASLHTLAVNRRSPPRQPS